MYVFICRKSNGSIHIGILYAYVCIYICFFFECIHASATPFFVFTLWIYLCVCVCARATNLLCFNFLIHQNMRVIHIHTNTCVHFLQVLCVLFAFLIGQIINAVKKSLLWFAKTKNKNRKWNKKGKYWKKFNKNEKKIFLSKKISKWPSQSLRFTLLKLVRFPWKKNVSILPETEIHTSHYHLPFIVFVFLFNVFPFYLYPSKPTKLQRLTNNRFIQQKKRLFLLVLQVPPVPVCVCVLVNHIFCNILCLLICLWKFIKWWWRPQASEGISLKKSSVSGMYSLFCFILISVISY